MRGPWPLERILSGSVVANSTNQKRRSAAISERGANAWDGSTSWGVQYRR
jgi:hypothetical protein